MSLAAFVLIAFLDYLLWRPLVRWPNAIWQYLKHLPGWTPGRVALASVFPWLLVGAAVLFHGQLQSMADTTGRDPLHAKTARVAANAVHHMETTGQRLRDDYDAFPNNAVRAIEPPTYAHSFLWLALFCLKVSATLFAFSLLALGPLHVLIGLTRGLQTTPVTVAGRPLRRIPSFPTLRAKRADRHGRWLLGSSLTTGKPVTLGPERTQHTWIVGGTGSGKTVGALLPALRSDILAGRGVILMDGKAEHGTAETLYRYAVDAGRAENFRYLNLYDAQHSGTYSPLIHGTATEKKDKLMASFEWSEPHYKKRCEDVLLQCLMALEAGGSRYTLEDLRTLIQTPLAMKWVARKLQRKGDPVAQEIAQRLEQLLENWKEVEASTTGLTTDLGLLTTTHFGPIFETTQPTIDFWNAYREGHIVYLGLPTMAYQESAVRLARIMLSDLKTVVCKIQSELPASQRPVMTVAIDEFASFAFEQFAELINKARSANVQLMLAHQSLSGDLLKTGDYFFKQIVANTNVKICLRQDDPDDAELFARITGTHTTHRRTVQLGHDGLSEHATGLQSDREVEAFNISPNIIKSLPTGRAAVVCSNPRWVDVLHLWPQNPKSTTALPLRVPGKQKRGMRLHDHVMDAWRKAQGASSEMERGKAQGKDQTSEWFTGGASKLDKSKLRELFAEEH